MSVFGGKIKTYRRLAEAALDLLAQSLPELKSAWTAGAPLPGGDIPNADFGGFLADFRRAAPWLPEALARRYARAYGTRVDRLLAGALHEAEIDYLTSQEWAQTAQDILWRRSMLGLHVAPETAQRLAARLAR